VTKDPGDAWEGSLRASGAQHDERTFSASIAGPLAETLSVRVGGRYNEYGGEYTNTLTGKKVGSERDWTVNTTLVWKPTENFRARLFGQRREQRDGPLALFLWGGDQNNCAPGFRSIGYRGVGATGAPSTSFAQGQLPPNANVNQYYCGAIPARPDLIRLNTDQISRVNPANRDRTGKVPMPNNPMVVAKADAPAPVAPEGKADRAVARVVSANRFRPSGRMSNATPTFPSRTFRPRSIPARP